LTVFYSKPAHDLARAIARFRPKYWTYNARDFMTHATAATRIDAKLRRRDVIGHAPELRQSLADCAGRQLRWPPAHRTRIPERRAASDFRVETPLEHWVSIAQPCLFAARVSAIVIGPSPTI
jgi:hypothetical protein